MSLALQLKDKTLAVSIIAALGGLGSAGYQLFEENFGSHAVVIATSPAGAKIRIEGKDRGKAPTTIALKRGTYTIEAQRDGFEPAQQAFFVSRRESNLVNIQLIPRISLRQEANANQTPQNAGPNTDDRVARIDAELTQSTQDKALGT